ncbi:hypothetical protein CONCODRAFT_83975 [Conidiobolus coronatus NRRL 28638]|uniref:MICOS complex subunit n=1 Tax=Conidiobolus coronatus (strain ATCC 28846 / CBS 209.66 / NRRL 28638) TaxID=796925 RepID=A0A137PC69_CONC2|nr:hypothetical protein CONCODRAFT_83975 [Conidiobolus coronatus NRRL 28638]|eukprot:KXN72531.1 hypothetical protein CONCODRAFT_83975 [Conidiobolus coronatus NRRL 28638]
MSDKINTKPSIYDNEVAQVVYLETEPTRVENWFRETRLEVNKNLEQANNKLKEYVNYWIGAEKKVEKTVKEIVPKNEKLLPGALYVGVIGLSGFIFARRRNILVRFLAPIAFTDAAALYFLPGTTNNIHNKFYQFYLDNKDKINLETINNVVSEAPKTVEKVPTIIQEAEVKAEQLLKEGEKKVQEAVAQAKSDTEKKIEEVEAMYTTRDKPGVRNILQKASEK